MAVETYERIALVFGIPTSAQEFDQRSRLMIGWDYGQSMHVQPGDPDKRFETTYQQHMAAMLDLMDQARRMGVKVLQCATLATLNTALYEHDVVVLIAHWRGSAIRPDDLYGDWRTTLQYLLDTANSPTGAELRNLAIGAHEFDRQSLTRALNRLIEGRALVPYLPADLAGRVAAHELMLRALSRDMIDAAFDGALRLGNQLELFDGLHAPADVSAALPPGFTGTFDLSCCTSNVLSDLLRLQHGDRMSIVASTQKLPPGAHMRLIECALRIVMEFPGTCYLDARFACAAKMYNSRV